MVSVVGPPDGQVRSTAGSHRPPRCPSSCAAGAGSRTATADDAGRFVFGGSPTVSPS